MAAPKDKMRLNVSGARMTVSTSTLKFSGATYFEALLERWTPAALAATTNNNDNDYKENNQRHAMDMDKQEEEEDEDLFIDCDPKIFSDVLYFMRHHQINPCIENDSSCIKRLLLEAEYFGYKALSQACQGRLLEQRKPLARSTTWIVTDDEFRYTIPDGEVVYLDSCTFVRNDLDDSHQGGYISLNYNRGNVETRELESKFGDYVIASQDCSKNHSPSRHGLQMCLSSSNEFPILVFRCGTFPYLDVSCHVHVWIGKLEGIPHLKR